MAKEGDVHSCILNLVKYIWRQIYNTSNLKSALTDIIIYSLAGRAVFIQATKTSNWDTVPGMLYTG